ncbi:MAG: hypothetical protein ING31_07990 [Burkholderiales bacterium]|nr:hypothetical protein [Burkholderiales bacterium]
MKRFVVAAALLVAAAAIVVPISSPQAAICRPAFSGEEKRPGHRCVGRWEMRPSGGTAKCPDGSTKPRVGKYCTAWEPEGHGGRLFDRNNMNPKVENPNRRDPRSTTSGKNRVDPPPPPKLN